MFSERLASFVVAGGLAAPPAFAQSRLAGVAARGHLTCAAFPRPSPGAGDARGLERPPAGGLATPSPSPRSARRRVTTSRLSNPPEDDKAVERRRFRLPFPDRNGDRPKQARRKSRAGAGGLFRVLRRHGRKGSGRRSWTISPARRSASTRRIPPPRPWSDISRKGRVFIAMPFQEDVEWRDAYNARHCRAAASEMTDLIALRGKRASTVSTASFCPKNSPSFPSSRRRRPAIRYGRPQSPGSLHFFTSAQPRAIDRDATALGLQNNWRADFGRRSAITARFSSAPRRKSP